MTPKQENFCLSYIETGNASEAYRRSYDAEKTSEPVINVEATKLLANPKIAIRLAELRAPILERHRITVDDIITELNENRNAALTAVPVQSSAATSATMAKAKLLGFVVEKQEINKTLNMLNTINIEALTIEQLRSISSIKIKG